MAYEKYETLEVTFTDFEKYTTQTLISINVYISIGLKAMNLLL